MKIFNTRDIREIDAFTIQNEPVASIELMERAAKGCSHWLEKDIPIHSEILIFTGPGNNGGDGWAIARLLNEKGYKHISIYNLLINNALSPDAEVNRNRVLKQGNIKVCPLTSIADFPSFSRGNVIIDALFGSGLNRSLEGLPAMLVKHINQSGCRVISVDIPSGLFGEDNRENQGEKIICASDTLTFQFPKRSFFFAENEKYTGRWNVIPIGLHPEILDKKESSFFYVTPEIIRPLLRKRKIFSHKGQNGHALLVAGTYGMMGAAILAARACLRCGTGLLTTHVPGYGYPLIQSVVPESIFSLDQNNFHFTRLPHMDDYNAAGIGPGLGKEPDTVNALLQLIECKIPMVIDADAINIISGNKDMLQLIPENTIFTPHPGEFDRLAGKSSGGFERNLRQIEFSKQYKHIIILKGAYSSISLPDGRCYFNSTGNPGMSVGGSGDVLTGIILSLLAQGYTPENAAITGTFIHGLAGDMATAKSDEHAIIASDIIENLGNAFKKIRNNETSETN